MSFILDNKEDLIKKTTLALPIGKRFYKILLLAFDTTCNLDCSYCFDKFLSVPNNKGTFTNEQLFKIIDKVFLEYSKSKYDNDGFFISISSGEYFYNLEKINRFEIIINYMSAKLHMFNNQKILFKIFSNFSTSASKLDTLFNFLNSTNFNNYVIDFTFHLEQLSLDFYIKKLKELKPVLDNNPGKFVFLLMVNTYTDKELEILIKILKEYNYDYYYIFNVLSKDGIPDWIPVPKSKIEKFKKMEVNIETNFINYNYIKKFYSVNKFKFSEKYNIFIDNINDYDRCFKNERLSTRKKI